MNNAVVRAFSERFQAGKSRNVAALKGELLYLKFNALQAAGPEFQGKNAYWSEFLIASDGG